MKKRLIALMMATCMAMAPVSCFAEDETDYSYLEDMSVKELKELRDAINKVLGDSGDSSETSDSGFGTLTGTITYYFNEDQGHIADTNSKIIMVRDDAENLDINDINAEEYIILSLEENFHFDFGEGVYSAQVNNDGVYTLNHIPAGEYFAMIVSGQTMNSAWFDAKTDAEKAEFHKIIGLGWDGRITEDDAFALGESTCWSKYTYEKISIYDGETTTFNYDFGYATD